MAKAWQAPKYTGGFRHHITTHALERYRERVEDTHSHRPDEDLARLLDERIKSGMDSRSYFEVIDSGRPDVTTTVVVLEQYGSGTDRPHVVMRPHRVIFGAKSAAPGAALYGPDQNALAAITVLTAEMATKAIEKRTWVALDKAREMRPPPAPPTLAARPLEALAGVTIQPRPPLPLALPAPTPAPTSAEKQSATLPEGWKQPEHREERRAWARAYFMENPSATLKDAHRAATERFGVGIADRDIAVIKDEVLAYLTQIGRAAIAGATDGAGQNPPTPAPALRAPTVPVPLRAPTVPVPAPTDAERWIEEGARRERERTAARPVFPGAPQHFEDDDGRLILQAHPKALAANKIDVVRPPAGPRDVTAIATEYGLANAELRNAEAGVETAKAAIRQAEINLADCNRFVEQTRERVAALLAELTGGGS